MFDGTRQIGPRLLVVAGVVAFLVAGALSASSGRVSAIRLSVGAVAAPTPPDAPSYNGYKGVKIGMPIAEARNLLGKARDTSDFEDYFVYSDKETLQVVYENKVVKAISVNYVGAGAGAPDPKTIFGENVEAKADGSIYKMVKYPKAGYWIMYNRTSGDDPLVMITVQKMAPGQ